MGYVKEFTEANGEMGQMGHEWVNLSSPATAGYKYIALQASEASVITYTEEKENNVNTDISIPAGFTIVGKMSNVSVASGNIIAYIGQK